MEEKREQSEFNSAVTYLNRLNTLWAMADDARTRYDSSEWFNTLCIIFSELSTAMKKKEEIPTYLERMAVLNTKVQQQQNVNQRSARQMITWELNLELIRFDLDLRKVMDEAGLQNKKSSDPRRALM